jgi:hypothetical protein
MHNFLCLLLKICPACLIKCLKEILGFCSGENVGCFLLDCVLCVVTSVSDEHISFVFRVEMCPENGGSAFFRNVGNHLQD